MGPIHSNFTAKTLNFYSLESGYNTAGMSSLPQYEDGPNQRRSRFKNSKDFQKFKDFRTKCCTVPKNPQIYPSVSLNFCETYIHSNPPFNATRGRTQAASTNGSTDFQKASYCKLSVRWFQKRKATTTDCVS